MDYIKRSDAMEEIADVPTTMSICISLEECHGMQVAKSLIETRIKAIPAADVRPVVRGKWVHPVPGDGEPYCSACHAEAEYFYGYGSFEPDYCPNCGADMRKPPKEET